MNTSNPLISSDEPRAATMWEKISRVLIAGTFVSTGSLHFLHSEQFTKIVPPGLPAPRALVFISGVCEIAGGLGVLAPGLRRWAGWGLVALLVSVFPANLYMALRPERFGLPRWMLWARAPLQVPMIAWVWWSACRRETRVK